MPRGVILKSEKELSLMRECGLIAATVMKRTLGWIHPYITTSQVDAFIESQIKSFHAKPSFKGFEGYPFASCISVNEEVVHGIPSRRKIKKGDLVSIDLGVFYNGFHSDMCGTLEVGVGELYVGENKKGNSSWKIKGGKQQKFLEIGIGALDAAIKACVVGNYIGDISYSMQRVVESAGYSVVRDLVGHGVGRSLHEPPQVPCYGKPSSGFRLTEGLVIAIEVMYTKGGSNLVLGEDGWTFSTRDGSLSAMFEHTVAITSKGTEVLTKA